MRPLARYYRSLLRAELAASAAYRAQLVVGLFGWVVPFVMIALWRGAAGDGTIEGITGAQFSTYFVGVLVATTLGVGGAVVFGVGDLVHSGKLSPLLLRPHHPVHTIVARQVAENLTRLVPLLLVAIATITLLDGALADDVRSWLLAPPLMVVGIVGTVYISVLVGSLAMWMTKSAGVQGLIFGVEWIIGGVIAPVVLLPPALTAIARVQPLWFAIGAPAELVSGISPASDGAVALGLGLVWIAGLHVVVARVWRVALVRYEAVGT